MQTVSSSFTAVGVSSEITIDPGQTVAYALSGTFAGTLALQRSDDGGATWKQVASATAAASGSYTNETLSHERVRWACLAYTSGTAVALIAKIEELLGVPQTTVGIGAGNGSTVFVKEYGNGLLHKTIITCVRTPVTITDDAGVAQYGGAGKLYTFPQGLINTLGAVIDGDVTLGTTGTIINTWAGGVALGTATATTGATLVGTEANIMQEVDVAAATSKVASVDAVSAATALTEAGARWLDGTTTAIDMYLNLVVDDDASHTSGTGTFTGTVTITWINLGDK